MALTLAGTPAAQHITQQLARADIIVLNKVDLVARAAVRGEAGEGGESQGGVRGGQRGRGDIATPHVPRSLSILFQSTSG